MREGAACWRGASKRAARRSAAQSQPWGGDQGPATQQLGGLAAATTCRPALSPHASLPCSVARTKLIDKGLVAKQAGEGGRGFVYRARKRARALVQQAPDAEGQGAEDGAPPLAAAAPAADPAAEPVAAPAAELLPPEPLPQPQQPQPPPATQPSQPPALPAAALPPPPVLQAQQDAVPSFKTVAGSFLRWLLVSTPTSLNGAAVLS